MIKSFVINNSMNLVKNNNNYNEEQLEEIKYGLESIYLLLTKFIVIISLSILFGILKETLILLLTYNFLRVFAFGIHASKSLYCWISSSIIFLAIPLICKNFIFSNILFIISSLFCLLSFVLFAPADTEKRPLINAKKRKIYKYLSILFAVIYIILIFTTKNVLLKNIIMSSLIIQTILILPITYKVFKLPYNNYKNYK